MFLCANTTTVIQCVFKKMFIFPTGYQVKQAIQSWRDVYTRHIHGKSGDPTHQPPPKKQRIIDRMSFMHGRVHAQGGSRGSKVVSFIYFSLLIFIVGVRFSTSLLHVLRF